MPFSGSGPGKTAPKLLHDFLHFDPLNSPSNSNYLLEFTPPVGEGPQLYPAPKACKHEYTPKWPQSVAPPLDSRPRGGDQYKIAVICKRCRLHADVHIIYPLGANPCPNEDYPLHHFQRHPPGEHFGLDRIVCAWLCSAAECNAQLKITYRKPRLEPADRDLLTDTEKLRRRYEEVRQDDPDREGIKQATPVDALHRLRRYIKDGMNTEHAKREFPANNKRFMEAFGLNGRDCAALLTRLGFTYSNDHWTLPQPPVLDDRLSASGESHREVLEDIEMELLAWTSKLATETNVANPSAGEGWPSADRDIERLLAAQGYTRHISLRRAGVPNDILPYFASLGALHDFADGLIDFAFERQSLCDPERRPYYFECLQVIAEHRSTEQLHLKVATLASQDLVSRRDLKVAYDTLRIDPSETDERVLNLYYVWISDIGAEAQENARQALYKIGLVRGSQQLINTAQRVMETYEDALQWLGNGVDKATPDDMLLSIVPIKMGESKDNEESVRKAIQIIAKERNSSTLETWLQTGQAGEYQMSPDEALCHLGVDVKFDQVDYTVLPAIFDSARSDRPGEQTEKAIAVLERAMKGGSSTSHSPETWPVGLESHGNTCYLNSLLQYYFSVAPLREIILNFDDYKLDTTKYTEKVARVGWLHVSMTEVKGGQQFADDMKHLFQRMIKSPSDKVKPEQDLVCRAFLSPRDYALMASSFADDSAAQRMQVNGVENVENAEDAIEDKVPDETSGLSNADDRHQSDASSVTLQVESSNDDIPMKDSELPLTPPDSGGEEKEEKPATAPPLPPRRFSTTKEQALLAAQSKAAQQQDVADVHENIMWRLQAGMMPKGQDEATEEQQDAIRDLFEIVFTTTPVENGIEGKPTYNSETNVQLGSFAEDTDLYAMLDAKMDLQQAEGGNKTREKGIQTYKSLRSLPPLLQINIPRIVHGEGAASWKSTACIKLEDELYLDRYCENSGGEVLEKRRKCWEWRNQLHVLKKEQKALSSTVADLDGPTAVSEAAKYLDNLSGVNGDLESVGLEGVEVDPDLSAALAADAETQKQRLAAMNDEIKKLEVQVKDQFDEKNIKYRLAAVMFHRGASSHGHYWACIHDFENDMWRIYNDERVEEFTKIGEILEARLWEHGTPTFAVYVRDDQKSELIRPLCRSPEKPLTPEPSEPNDSNWEDVTMANGESQAAQPASVDPKLTVKNEAEGAWDEPRSVPDMKCTPYFHDNGVVKFVLNKKDAASQSPVAGEGSTSPKRRHDSTSADDAKRARPKSDEDGAVKRLVEGIDDTQLDGGKE